MADIIHRIGIQAPAAQVYEAIVTAEGVAGWWTRNTTATGDRRLNSRFLRDDGTVMGEMDYELSKQVPGREAHWRFVSGPEEWLPTTVTFELSEEGDMTIVNFGHRDWHELVEFMGHCSMKWAVFLLSLRQYLETGAGQPSPDDLKIDNWN